MGIGKREICGSNPAHFHEGLLRKRREERAHTENGSEFRDPGENEQEANPKLDWQGREGQLSFYEAKNWNLESVWFHHG